MTALDWVGAGVLGLSLLLGLWRGLVYELLSVAAWVAAFVAAQWLAADAAAWLPLASWGEPLRHAAGFAAVFVVAVFAGGLLAWLAKRLVEAVGLRPVDRALGAAFGLVRGVVLVLAATVVVLLTPARESALWTESGGAAVATAALKGLKPVLPEPIGRHLPG